jgi:hypothetical protein
LVAYSYANCDVRPQRGGDGAGRQARDVPGPLDRVAQPEDPVDVHVLPAAERLLADAPPEVAAAERRTAAAPLAVA